MKKSCCVMLSVLMLLLLFTPAFAEEKAVPLCFETDEYTFSDITYGQTSEEVFTAVLKNTGSETLVFNTMQLYTTQKDSVFTVPDIYLTVLTELKPGETYCYPVGIAEYVPAGKYEQTYTVFAAQPQTISVSLTVRLKVEKADYKVPTVHLYATYNDWLHSVQLPQTDNGSYRWWDGYNRSTKVGNVGDNIFYATYTPPDQNNYHTIEKLPVTITVLPAKTDFEVPKLSATCGQTLADAGLCLPFAWCVKSPERVSLKYGVWYYSATYFPKDSENDVTLTVDIPVTVSHQPNEMAKVVPDGENHVYICICGEKTSSEPHEAVLNPETGIRECRICHVQVTETEETPKNAWERFFNLIKEKLFKLFSDLFQVFR